MNTQAADALHEVITFYSYKGGTGRTMALANIACLFALQRGESKRVLAIDWDLEAPGLHYYLPPADDDESPERQKSGVVEYFTRIQQLARDTTTEGESQEDQAEAILNQTNLADYCLSTNIPGLDIMLAGCFDDTYQSRLSSIDWHSIYEHAPAVFRCFAEKLASDYDVVLIDSRTGMTDISGICTSLLPDKLVVVFTPNQQSLAGIEDLVESSVKYRQNSRDLRALLVYPLPSRIDAEREELRQQWRLGGVNRNIEGYQPQFERIFKSVYALSECDLTQYCNEVQIQHSPDYSYGEGVAAIKESEADRFSIVTSYKALLKWLQASAAPWEDPETIQRRKRLVALLDEERQCTEQSAASELHKYGLQRDILELTRVLRGPEHIETITIIQRLIETALLIGNVSDDHDLVIQLARSLPVIKMPNRIGAIGLILNAANKLRTQAKQASSAENLVSIAVDALKPDLVRNGSSVLPLIELARQSLIDCKAFSEATALQQKLVTILSAVLGENHSETLKARSSLIELEISHGNLGEDKNDLQDARKLQESILIHTRSSLGEEHIETIEAMDNLAGTLKEDGDLNGALALEERVLEICIGLYFKGHPATLKAMHNLASTHTLLGSFNAALFLRQEILDLTRRRNGDQHPDTLTAMNNLSGILLELGDLGAAQQLQRETLVLQQWILKANPVQSIHSDKIMNNSSRVPIEFRAQVASRAQRQFIQKPKDAPPGWRPDIQVWIDEWVERVDTEVPFTADGLHIVKVQIDWRLISNSGIDESIIRPVIGAGGWPLLPGSSIKGLFRRACSPDEAQRWCGGPAASGDLLQGKLRFHGAWPTDVSWTQGLLDVAHPQQNWQLGFTNGRERHSAFGVVSLHRPLLTIALSSTEPLDNDEWALIDATLRRSLERGIGGRTVAGYGSSGRIDGDLIFQVGLEGQGPAPKLLDGSAEFRPNIFRAAIRGMALRLFGGLTDERTTLQVVGQLFGTLTGEADQSVGLLSTAYTGSQTSMGTFGTGSWSQPVFATSGQLQWRQARGLKNGEDGLLLVELLAQLHGLTVTLGGFGRGWRRPDHRIFAPWYDKTPIGTHWQWLNTSELPNGVHVQSVEDLENLLRQAHSTARRWLAAVGLRSANPASWREVLSPDRVGIWVRRASEPQDAEAVGWFHKTPEADRNGRLDPRDLKRTEIGGRVNLVGRIWNRMLPLYAESGASRPVALPSGEPIARPAGRSGALARPQSTRDRPAGGGAATARPGAGGRAASQTRQQKLTGPVSINAWGGPYLESIVLFVAPNDRDHGPALQRRLDEGAGADFRRIRFTHP
jgi:CRISPR-associated protein Cmr6